MRWKLYQDKYLSKKINDIFLNKIDFSPNTKKVFS